MSAWLKPVANKDTLQSIQALRAIAATLVVVLHSFVHLQARDLIPSVPALVDTGRVGVDIFFVISGFIMVYISGGKFKTPGAPRDFIVRRLIRVAPTYWLYTLVMGALLFSSPQSFSDGKTFSTQHLLASLFFVPWDNSIGYVKPVLNVGWTLNYEIYFYLLFAFLLFFNRKYLIPLLSLVLLSGIVAGSLLKPESPIYSVVTSSLTVEFLFGCLIAAAYKRQLHVPAAICLLLVLVGISILLLTGIYGAPGIPRAIKWGGGSAMLVAGALFLERSNRLRVPALLASLGNSSYSLYLTHLFTINALGKIWALVLGAHYIELFIVAAIISSLIAGHIAFLLVEKPLTTYLNRAYARRRAAVEDLRQVEAADP